MPPDPPSGARLWRSICTPRKGYKHAVSFSPVAAVSTCTSFSLFFSPFLVVQEFAFQEECLSS